MLGDELDDGIVHRLALLLGLVPQDGDTGLDVRLLHVGDEAALQPGADALLQIGDLLGRTVGADDDLLACVVQGVEGVEELLLDGLAVGDELDVVDHEQVHVPEPMPKLCVLAHADGFDELVGEGLAGHVQDPGGGIVLLHRVADGVHQVGLSKAHASIEEQGVIGMAGGLGHRLGGGVGYPVGVAHHEGIEGIPGVQGVDAGGSGIFTAVEVPALVGQNEHHVDDLGVGLLDAHAHRVLVVFADGGLGGGVRTLDDQDAVLDGDGLQNVDPAIEAEGGHLPPHIFTGQGPNAFDLFHSIFSLSIVKLNYNSREKPKKQRIFWRKEGEKHTGQHIEIYIFRATIYSYKGSP